MKALATTPVAARATPPSHEGQRQVPLRTLFLSFLGVEAAVIGVLLHVTLDLGARALRGWRPLGGC
jgi:hypothetical protein